MFNGRGVIKPAINGKPFMSPAPAADRFAAFRHVSYTRFFFARFLVSFAAQIISVSVGWQMYDQTGSAIYLGLIGLVQFLPSLLLTLVTGSIADRYSRRNILAASLVIWSVLPTVVTICPFPGWDSERHLFIIGSASGLNTPSGFNVNLL